MKPYVWKEGMSEKEMRDGAYFERNMLALFLAMEMNRNAHEQGYKKEEFPCGWYLHGEWEGWSRVISIDHGKYTFHVPDDFDLGWLHQLKKPNWNGHSTQEKWETMMDLCGIKTE